MTDKAKRLIDPYDDGLIFERLMTCAIAAANFKEDKQLLNELLQGKLHVEAKKVDGEAYFILMDIRGKEICRVSSIDAFGLPGASPN